MYKIAQKFYTTIIHNMDINAETLREIRNKSGLSQTDFAKKLGLKFRSYQNYELGHPIPKTKKELILYKLKSLNWLDDTKNVQYVENKGLLKKVQENRAEYDELRKDYIVRSYPELIDLKLRLMANFEELKKEPEIKTLLEREYYERRLKEENIL